MTTTIGILGAGNDGAGLARLALAAGYRVLLAGPGDPARNALTSDTVIPGAIPVRAAEAVVRADIVILALPLSEYWCLPATELVGALVIDAMNHRSEVDGPRDTVLEPGESSSEAVQHLLLGARVVKALNHMASQDLEAEARVRGAAGRKAIAIAGDDGEDVQVVSELVDRLGFDPLVIGPLSAGARLEPGTPAFGAAVGIDELRMLTGVADSDAVSLAVCPDEADRDVA